MTHRDYEYMKPSNMAGWLKDFAEAEAMRKEGNYIDHIQQILNPNASFNSVEAMVTDLRERVGLDLIKEAGNESAVTKLPVDMAPVRGQWNKILNGNTPCDKYLKTDGQWHFKQLLKAHDFDRTKIQNSLKEIRHKWESEGGEAAIGLLNDMIKNSPKKKAGLKASIIQNLIRLANKLDSEGKTKEAMAVDRKIQALAKESKESEESEEDTLLGVLDDPKTRKALEQIDKIIEEKGGHVTGVSLQAMIEHEKGISGTPELTKYIEDKIKEVRANNPEAEEATGMFGTDIQPEDKEANDQMFDVPNSSI